MLKIYKEKIGVTHDPEKFFNENMRSFALNSKPAEVILYGMERASYANGILETPYGKGTPEDLCIPTKLALCLTFFPGLVFEYCKCRSMFTEYILNLPEGSLYMKLDKPLQYYFPIKVQTASGIILDSSTSLNVWMFNTGR